MKLSIKSASKTFLIAGLCYLSTMPLMAKAGTPRINTEYFDIKAEPSRADWQFFMRANENNRMLLWKKHLKRGKHLKDWSWGWRLGWVRSCAQSKQHTCHQLLAEALFDRALVVRAEAASRLGNLYAGSANNKIIGLLERAFTNKSNTRGGHPLFIQQRILYALHLIGDPSQKNQAKKLAALHPDTREYWRRLEAATISDD